MTIENTPDPQMAEALLELGSRRMHDLGLILMSDTTGQLEKTAAMFNFSIVAMAQDELAVDDTRGSSPYDPVSWISTARDIIEAESEISITGKVLMNSVFFAGDKKIQRGLNRWVSSKIPSGVYRPEEFAADVLSGQINMMNPRDN